MKEQVTQIYKRKDEHLRICLEENVSSNISAGFETVRLKVNALPELDFAQVDPSTELFGKKLSYPILISSMTGGSGKTKHFNQLFARTAAEFGIAMGVGSQRAAIVHPELEDTYKIVRKEAPNALLFANLGVVQLNKGFGLSECQKAVDMLQADGLYLHLNSLQEILQPEGDRDFSGLLEKIEHVIKGLSVPVLVKEVGCGISQETAKQLIDIGVKGIDVAGAGGTSWAAVEMHRVKGPVRAKVCQTFIDWGIPTVDALKSITSIEDLPVLISSGGLRNGIDIAKSIALGADLAGFAMKFIKAADLGKRILHDTIRQLVLELKTTMFTTGAKNLSELKNKIEN